MIIGIFYYRGFGIDRNDNTAFKWYMKASQQNDINGHLQVGSCYNYGYGIEKNVEKAFQFYQLAANNGLNIALHNLAECYKFGIGVEKDSSKAIELFKESFKNIRHPIKTRSFIKSETTFFNHASPPTRCSVLFIYGHRIAFLGQ